MACRRLTVLLITAATLISPIRAGANPIQLRVAESLWGQRVTYGDPAVAPVVGKEATAPSELWLASTISGPTVTQSGQEFDLTGLPIGCLPNVLDCGPAVSVDFATVAPLDWADITGATLHIDGTVRTSDPEGISVYAYMTLVDAGHTDSWGNHFTHPLGIGIDETLLTGGFDFTSVSPLPAGWEGTAESLRVGLIVRGLKPGDLFALPNSLSVDIESAIPAPVPEPTSLILLGTGLAGAVSSRRRRRS